MSKFAMRSKAVPLALALTILTPLPLLAESPAPDAAKPSIASIVVLPAPANGSTPVTAPGSQSTTATAQTTETQQTRAALPSATAAAASQQPAQTAQLQRPVKPAKERLATRHPRQQRVRSSQAFSGSSITTQIARIMRRPEVQSLLVQYGAD